jgi:hypothetical protein
VGQFRQTLPHLLAGVSSASEQLPGGLHYRSSNTPLKSKGVKSFLSSIASHSETGTEDFSLVEKK